MAVGGGMGFGRGFISLMVARAREPSCKGTKNAPLRTEKQVMARPCTRGEQRTERRGRERNNREPRECQPMRIFVRIHPNHHIG